MNEADDFVAAGIDRRALLTKAAAAGAVAWAAPTILSSAVVEAQTACTYKCGPIKKATFTCPAVKVTCQQNGPLNDWHPYTFSLGTPTQTGAVCGCGGVPEVTLSGATTFKIEENQWTHQYCNPSNPDPKTYHIGVVGDFGGNNPAAKIYATITCLDRRKRKVTSTCEIRGTFTYCHSNWPNCASVPSNYDITWETVTCTNPPTCST